MPIPKSVNYEELHNSLSDFYVLMGIAKWNVYSDPAITIGAEKITFVVPVTTGAVEMTKKRARGHRDPAYFPHPQGDPDAEMSYVVTVAVTGSGHSPWAEILQQSEKTLEALEENAERLDLIQATLRSTSVTIGETLNAATRSSRKRGGK